MKLDKAKIKGQIYIEIEKTQFSIESLVELTQPISPENSIGRISRMDAINNKSVNEASLRQAKIKLDKLEKAAKKIDEKDFGICIRCGQPIPIGRIMLIPEADKCVKCA